MKTIVYVFFAISAMSAFTLQAVESQRRMDSLVTNKVDISFARGKWNPADFIPVKSWRWDYMGVFDQLDDGIVNRCPDLPGDQIYKKHHSAVYAALMYKGRFAVGEFVSSTMMFDYRMAPILVLAEDLGRNAKTGEPEFRDHWEVCLYDRGVNVWHHFFVDGVQKWHKASSLLLPEREYFKANVKYDLQVTVDYNKNGRKEMKVAVGDYQFTYVDDLLPDTFQAGIIACEGRNFFYDFKARRTK